MELQLFDWDEYDINDESCYTFTNCQLKIKIGDFEKDEIVPLITVDYSKGTMMFMNSEGDELTSFDLELKVKE